MSSRSPSQSQLYLVISAHLAFVAYLLHLPHSVCNIEKRLRLHADFLHIVILIIVLILVFLFPLEINLGPLGF